MDKPENKERIPLSDLGEFGLINHIQQQTEIHNQNTWKGIGDDAAVMISDEQAVLVTTDLLLEGIHFNLVYVPLKHLGYKAVIASLSDVYAMNACPRQITVSMAVSSKFSLSEIDALYEGIHHACERYRVDLVGGDTSSSLTGLSLSVTAIGYADKQHIVYRAGAEKNDLICVSGDLGAAYLGLQILERERIVFESNPNIQPDLEGHDYVIGRQLKPEARKELIDFFKEQKILPTSMIDVSDGLASDLLHICHQSKTGCAVYEEKIPVDPTAVSLAEEFHMSPTICALNGGEDYELLFTIQPKDYEKIKKNRLISVIGHITEQAEGCHLITHSNSVIQLTAQGWDAFLKRQHTAQNQQ